MIVRDHMDPVSRIRHVTFTKPARDGKITTPEKRMLEHFFAMFLKLNFNV